MGGSLLSGLLRSGHPVDGLVITERRADRAAELTDKYGVRVLDNAEAAALADTLLLVVKPQDMGALLAEIHDEVAEGNLVVSLAAGITTTFMQVAPARGPRRRQGHAEHPGLLVDQGMAAVSAGSHCSPEQLQQAQTLLGRHRQGGRRPREARTR